MKEKARALIAEHLDIGVDTVHDQATFRDLGADSLDLVALPLVLEEAFDVHIPDEFAELCGTVADAIALLTTCVEAASPAKSRSLAGV